VLDTIYLIFYYCSVEKAIPIATNWQAAMAVWSLTLPLPLLVRWLFSKKLVDLFVWNLSTVGFRCSVVSNLVFWIASVLGLYADHLVTVATTAKANNHKSATLVGTWLSRCKIQPKRIISGKDRDDLIKLAFFNMVFVACFVCCPLYEWVWSELQNNNGNRRLTDDDDWASTWKTELFVKLPIHALVAEASFFVVHGCLHYVPFLYQAIHSVHHRFRAPTAMACVYSHPLEFAVGNVLPIFLGPMVVTNAHPYTCYIWWGLAMLGTCKGHCGYRILGHIDGHEDHHIYYKYNYGGMGLLDHLVGTTPPLKTNNDGENTFSCSNTSNIISSSSTLHRS
jgi:sterol desaturase/sphingolipid hydroxylase (fatty acid hydroxylase superfamily)